MKRALFVVLLFSLPLLAQHRGGMGRPATFAHRGGGMGFARFASQPFYGGIYYLPPAPLPYYVPPAQLGWGWWVNGPAPVVWQSAPVQEAIIYIPTYMRPDNGPSLGEIARQIGVGKHKHPLGTPTIDMQN